jgi:putative membrane protein
MVRWLLASIHLIALGIGLGAIWVRGSALRRLRPGNRGELSRVFAADTAWGIAALLWITSGLIRAFGGFEKGTAYYTHNRFFMIKMSLLVLILVLEVWPMVTLIRWRIQTARGVTVNTTAASAFARISVVQAFLVVLMVCAATAMARGYGVLS